MTDVKDLRTEFRKVVGHMGEHVFMEAAEDSVRATTSMVLEASGKRFRFMVICEPPVFNRTTFTSDRLEGEVIRGGNLPDNSLKVEDTVTHTEMLLREFEAKRNENSSVRH